MWTEVIVNGTGKGGAARLSMNVGWQAKTTTRLAEASWVAFVPTVSSPGDSWRIVSLGSEVDPTDVVAHGAVHFWRELTDNTTALDLARGNGMNAEAALLEVLGVEHFERSVHVVDRVLDVVHKELVICLRLLFF